MTSLIFKFVEIVKFNIYWFLIMSIILILGSCDIKQKLNPAKIKIELDSIRILDQKRMELSALFQQYGSDSDEFKSALEKQNKIDSTNLIYVEKLINDYGKYPGKSLVGIESSDVAFFVLQHSSPEIQQKYIQTILQAGNDNELKKSLVAMFYDRYLIGMNKPQIYGSQIKFNKQKDSLTGEEIEMNSVYPILDTNSIDSTRMWNGLGPLEDYLNSFGISRWD